MSTYITSVHNEVMYKYTCGIKMTKLVVYCEYTSKSTFINQKNEY